MSRMVKLANDTSYMLCIAVRAATVAHPTGDPHFSVMQAFPSAVSAEEADPFLMCDEIGPLVTKFGPSGEDEFPVGWHGHLGMDICTYMREGIGRHADSLGNRGSFASPGLQWMSTGTGIEHAEGGGTPRGARKHGFQIWVNVPAARKRDAPRYGTEPPERLPLLDLGTGVGTARLLAGPTATPRVYEDGGAAATGDVAIGVSPEGAAASDVPAAPPAPRGPFETAQPVQMLDIELIPGARYEHAVPEELDNCIVYVYHGSTTLAGDTRAVAAREVALLDASDAARRVVDLTAGPDGAGMLLFAGKRINEPIFWHGPFVAASREELRAAFRAAQTGKFPPVRVPWDYRRASARPVDAQ